MMNGAPHDSRSILTEACFDEFVEEQQLIVGEAGWHRRRRHTASIRNVEQAALLPQWTASFEPLE